MEHIYNSPIGDLRIVYNNEYIVGLYFNVTTPLSENNTENDVLKACISQLDEYFEGKRKTFDLPLHFERGTDFQKTVWQALTNIPYGKTISYGELAKNIGNDKASRAVGGANNKNPISIIVPCHRVIGASGKMVGYGGELWRKEWLLRHEGSFP